MAVLSRSSLAPAALRGRIVRSSGLDGSPREAPVAGRESLSAHVAPPSVASGSGGPALRPSPAREIDAKRPGRVSVTVGAKADRCFPSHSPTLRPWIAGRSSIGAADPSSDVEGCWSPALLRACAEEPFSLRRGLNSELELLQAEHHPFVFES